MAAPVFRSATSDQAASADDTVEPTKPAGVVDGDLLLAFIRTGSASGGITPPAGWNLEAEESATNSKARLYSKIASGEGASWVWTTTWTAQAHCWACIAIQAGTFDAGDPVDAVSVQDINPSSSTELHAPSATATGDERLGVVFFAPDGLADATGLTDIVPPAGWTERTQTLATINPGRRAHLSATKVVNTGATGLLVATWDGLETARSDGITVLIAPTSGGTTPQSLSVTTSVTAGLSQDITKGFPALVVTGLPTVGRQKVLLKVLNLAVNAFSVFPEKVVGKALATTVTPSLIISPIEVALNGINAAVTASLSLATQFINRAGKRRFKVKFTK